MPPKPLPTDLPIVPFPNAAAFASFLSTNHSVSPGLHLKLAKKTSGIPSITGAEAVETALCFGWIDGQANGVDGDWWLVRFTPRRAKSMWSRKNVATVARLIEEGRMQPAGLAAVEAAKADGRWDKAYAGPATVEVPLDLTRALDQDEAAREFWNGLNKGDRYAVLWRLETASDNAREKRMEALVQMLAVGKVPGRPTKVPKPEPVKKGVKKTKSPGKVRG